jgi:hypothetical protein
VVCLRQCLIDAILSSEPISISKFNLPRSGAEPSKEAASNTPTPHKKDNTDRKVFENDCETFHFRLGFVSFCLM